MPQSDSERRITFGWEEVIDAVLRVTITNLVKKFLLKVFLL